MVAPPACGQGEDTPMILSLHRLARGLPRLLAARSPRATGLASSLSGCIFITGQRRPFRHRRRGGRLTGPAETSCPSRIRRSFCFRLSASFVGRRFNETSARVARPCWCAVTTFCPFGQLRFAQARNPLELLHPTHRGFSSRFAARFLSRLWHVRPCQKNR